MKLKLVATINKNAINDPMNPVKLPPQFWEVKPKIDELASTLTFEQIKEIVEVGAKELKEKHGISITQEEINQIIDELKDFKTAGLTDRVDRIVSRVVYVLMFLMGVIAHAKGQAKFAPGSSINEMQLGLFQQISGIGLITVSALTAYLLEYWFKKDKK